MMTMILILSIISAAILLTCIIITLILLTNLKKHTIVMSEMRNALVALCNMIGVKNIEDVVSGNILESEEPEEEGYTPRLW